MLVLLSNILIVTTAQVNQYDFDKSNDNEYLFREFTVVLDAAVGVDSHWLLKKVPVSPQR